MAEGFGFSAERVDELLGPPIKAPSRRAQRAALDRRLGAAPVDDFLRLFSLGLTLSPERAQ